ncbi:alpha/beta-hydrolase [Seiridium cupressi]
MSTPNPLASSESAPSVSKTTLPIAGLHVDIYGLAELAPNATTISCLWLHHPRLRVKEDMSTIASLALSSWHRHPSSSARGLIAVAFDQRNHGTRLISEPANHAWRQGNKTHAQDMFGTVSGMVVDNALLIDALEGYIFGNGEFGGGERKIDQHLALGVSLGGHSVWQALFAEPRISAGVAVIGCPDYVALISDRARKSKLQTFSAADNGASFLGSRDFPVALVRAVEKYDPKGILFGTNEISSTPSQEEQARLRALMDGKIKGKRIQVLSGGQDKLVPYAKSKPFLDFFKSAVETWYKDGAVSVEDIVYPEAGHEFNAAMMNDAVRFIVDEVSGRQPASARI